MSHTVVDEEYSYSITQRVVKRSADPGRGFAPIVEIIRVCHLHWTSDLPEEGGVYWMGRPNKCSWPRLVKICNTSTGSEIYFYGNDGFRNLQDYKDGYEWIGPIPIPECPEE